MAQLSREKGKAGEREAAHEISRLFNVQARRGQQFCGGPESPDVVGLPGVHVEVKRAEKAATLRLAGTSRQRMRAERAAPRPSPEQPALAGRRQTRRSPAAGDATLLDDDGNLVTKGTSNVSDPSAED
jgi:hypothetical protein